MARLNYLNSSLPILLAALLFAPLAALHAAGEKLLGDIIKAELVRTNEFGENEEAEAQILDVPLESDAVTIGENGEISLSFEGNRVVAVSDGSNPSGKLAIRLDGREVKTFPGAWAATRPSKSANWMPAIRHVARDGNNNSAELAVVPIEKLAVE